MARTVAKTENKLQAIIKRGKIYKETQGLDAFVGRLLRFWLWMPRLLGGRPAHLENSIAPLTDSEAEEVRPIARSRRPSATLQLDGYGELLDLVLRRLSRLEDAMNDLREGQARIEQRIAKLDAFDPEGSNASSHEIPLALRNDSARFSSVQVVENPAESS